VNIRQFFNVSRKHYLIAAFSGLLLTLCFPRIGLAPLAWAALIPLLFLVAANEPAACFTLGWIAGVCHGVSLLYWITFVVNHYGNLPLPVSLMVCFLLVAYLAIFPGLFCAGLGWFRQRGLVWVPLAPVLWVALELGKSRLLTGFPWENLGYSQYRWLSFIQIADIAGVYGISFVLVLSSALLYLIIFGPYQQKKPVARLLSVLLLIVLVSTVYGYGRWRLANLGSHPSRAFKVALVQGNIAQDTKWDPAFQQATLEKYLRLTTEVVEQQPDLVVWPETATPFYFLADLKNTRTLIKAVEKLKKPLLFGSPGFRRKGERLTLYNRAYLLDSKGMVTDYYDKIHLVPFGEYVPWKQLLFFVDKLVQATGDFAAGDRAVVMELPPARIGVLICYEAIFPELSRNLANGGANLLVNITNDAWFGRSCAPHQHLSMAVLRTVENRVPMVRCANTGISGLIDARGRILQASDLFEDATMFGTLQLENGNTIYSRHGDWFAWTCVVISLLGFGYALVRKKNGLEA
jgi:apolipoprotein N-acyltransferase